MKKKLLFFPFMVFVFVISCNNQSENKQNIRDDQGIFREKDLAQKYKGYIKSGTFDYESFYNENKGSWICFKYERDSLETKYPGFEYDDKSAKEFSNFFWFEIQRDSIVFNNTYKIPIDLFYQPIDSFPKSGRIRIKYLSMNDSVNMSLPFYYFIDMQDQMRYVNYHEEKMIQGDTLPYYAQVADPFSCRKYIYPNYIAFEYHGYNYYFKPGIPKSEGIIGIPSDINNHFEVKRVYKKCGIEQAAYKFIEEFPAGAMSLLIESDDPSMPGLSFSYESIELNTTEYRWINKDNLIIRVGEHLNCQLVFEFKKVGEDVHVKYWNDVVFPFEKGYQEY